VSRATAVQPHPCHRVGDSSRNRGFGVFNGQSFARVIK